MDILKTKQVFNENETTRKLTAPVGVVIRHEVVIKGRRVCNVISNMKYNPEEKEEAVVSKKSRSRV